jgi:hypothetical protein
VSLPLEARRFVLFYGWNFYPDGGWNDMHGLFSTMEIAQAAWTEILEKQQPDWCHIVDLFTEKLV